MPPRSTIAIATLVACLAWTWPALAAPPVQTYGPGDVSCQLLVGTRMDCLLAASRITHGNKNVVSFGLDALPRGEPDLFRKWCLAASDNCVVTITGRRASPLSTRLSVVTSIHWTRFDAPTSNSAARASLNGAPTERAQPDTRPVP